jgi:hypothetical protein
MRFIHWLLHLRRMSRIKTASTGSCHIVSRTMPGVVGGFVICVDGKPAAWASSPAYMNFRIS